MIDNRTANRSYPLPHADNLMRTEDLPRLISALVGIDADVAAVLAALATKASVDHTHDMASIIGLIAALAAKSSVGHTHGIGTLSGVDLSSAANGQFMRFNGTLWVPASIATTDLPNDGVTNAKLRNSAATSVIGRAANSTGDPADITASANDRILARVGDVLDFVQLTFAMIADATNASAADIRAGAASKLISPDAALSAMDWAPAAYAATIALDHRDGPNRKLDPLAGNPAIAAPTNVRVGYPLNLWIPQDATGSRVPSWNAVFDFGDYGTPVLSTGANQADLICFVALSATKLAFVGMRKRID